MISIIIPVYNEETTILTCLDFLRPWQEQGSEIIVVDGGSDDGTYAMAEGHASTVCRSARGRGIQMNTGARYASGQTLLFLHVDTRLPAVSNKLLQHLVLDENSWGRFDVTLSDERPVFRIIGFFMNLRSRITGIATGDQALFIHKSLFEKAGGFPEIPLMEDIAICKKLLQTSRPICLHQRVVTSSRRWASRGIIKTIFLMWYLRTAYFLGVKPEQLARLYAG